MFFGEGGDRQTEKSSVISGGAEGAQAKMELTE